MNNTTTHSTERLTTALRNAVKAGDFEAARALANAIDDNGQAIAAGSPGMDSTDTAARLPTALRNAVKAGDFDAAETLANAMERNGEAQPQLGSDSATMSVRLPNGKIVQNVPEGTDKRQVALKAIAAGIAEPDDFGGMFYSSGMYGRHPTIDVGAMRRQHRLKKLQESDPGLASVVDETGPLEALRIGYGEGTASWLRGLGLMEQASPEDRQAMAALRDQQPAAAVGKLAGQIAPFLVPGLGIARVPSLAARVGLGGALGSAEGAIIARGEGGGAEEIVQGAGLGLLFGTGAEVVGPVLSRLGRGLITRILGREAAAFDAAGNPTPELLDALRQSGSTIDDLVRAASNDPETLARLNAAQAADAARAARYADGTPPGSNFDQPAPATEAEPLLRDMAEGRVRPEDVRPDRATLDALDALGLSSAPAAVASQNPAFTGIYGAMAALPSRRQYGELIDFNEEAGRAARETMARLGGDLDVSAVSQRFRDRLDDLVEQASGRTNRAYRVRDEIIEARGGFGAEVDLAPLKQSLGQIARDFGGVDRLRGTNPEMARLLDEADKGMTFAHVDGVLKKLNSAKHEGATGGFADLADYQRQRLIDALENVRSRHVAALGPDAAEAYARANAANVQKKNLQAAQLALLGKELMGEIVPRVSSAIGARNIGRGNIKEWRLFMRNTPDELKGEVVATAITSNLLKDGHINPAQFRSFWENLSRQPALRAEVLKHLPERAADDLRNLYLLTRGLSNIDRTKVKTGFLEAVLRDIDAQDSWLTKLRGMGKEILVAEGVGNAFGGPGIGTLVVLARNRPQAKVDSAALASDVLARPEFREAVVDFVRRGRVTPAQNRRVRGLKAYRDWLAAQPPAVQSRVAAQGLIAWLFNDTEVTEGSESFGSE